MDKDVFAPTSLNQPWRMKGCFPVDSDDYIQWIPPPQQEM